MLEGRVIRAQIIWAKERLMIGRGDRKQTTLWTIASDGQDTETAHGTQKPVECMRTPPSNLSTGGESA